jgi:hypothetical protein
MAQGPRVGHATRSQGDRCRLSLVDEVEAQPLVWLRAAGSAHVKRLPQLLHQVPDHCRDGRHDDGGVNPPQQGAGHLPAGAGAELGADRAARQQDGGDAQLDVVLRRVHDGADHRADEEHDDAGADGLTDGEAEAVDERRVEHDAAAEAEQAADEAEREADVGDDHRGDAAQARSR